MADLRALYGSLGLTNATSYIQSGNVVFESADTDERKLAERLENAIEATFGFSVPVVLRSLGDWRGILRRNPFSGRADPAHLHVACLAGEPGGDAETALASLRPGADAFKVDGREVFLHCPNGYARSKLTNTALEKKLGMFATTRNWKTVNRVLALAEAVDS